MRSAWGRLELSAPCLREARSGIDFQGKLTTSVATMRRRQHLSTLSAMVPRVYSSAPRGGMAQSTSQVLDEAESHIARQISQVELLGEIAVDEPQIASLCATLGRLGLGSSRRRWPHCFATALVGIARYRYDGDAFWPHVRDAFGLGTLHAPEQQEIGQWFESYLARNGLPRFRHLVEQGALRYLTPILAHALVPRALLPAFLESVIWPSVDDPAGHGASGDDIQQRMARRAPVIARPLQRFVVHGGRVARDVIDRSIVVAAAASSGEEVNPGLPEWLCKAIAGWVQDRSRVGRLRPRPEQGRRWKAPILRFDPVYNRVQVELPYLDDPDSSWEVQLPGGGVHREPWKPAWQRVAPAASVTIERPFVALTTTLRTTDGIVGTRTFDGLTASRPCLFFEHGSGRAMGSSGFLTGSRWYVTAPTGAELIADGQALPPREHLGEPLGGWTGLEVSYYEASPATQRLEVRTSGSTFALRVVEQQPDARLEVPTLPAFLAANSEGVLAFESNLPTVILPPAPHGSEAEGYLSRWSARASADSEVTHERQPATALSPERLPDGTYRLHLEDLIPDVDVGDWTIEVTGPLGRGFASRISLLPPMTFEVDETPGVAGPELPAARVFVATRDGIRVVEEEDTATAAPDGWVLHDRNHNGRIPFTVRDSRTGRDTNALIQLGTVQWRWTGSGVTESRENIPERFSLDALDPASAPRLLASNPGTAALRLRLVDPAGRTLQEDVQRPLSRRGATFSLSSFLTTASTAAAPSLRLRLELVSGAGAVFGGTVVASLVHDVEPENVRVEYTDTTTAIHWQLPRSFPGASARVASLGRPWETPTESRVVEDDAGRDARVEVERLLPGRYQLGLWFDDGWVGRAPLGPPVEFLVGTGTELRKHILTLPPTVTGRLEDILLRGDGERRNALREFASGIGPYQLADLIGAVAGALAQGRGDELLSLPWTEVAPAVARLEQGDPLPLLDTVGTCGANSGLARFCVAIGLDRWPSLQRTEVPSALAPGLWEAWLPLGAFADLGRAGLDSGAAERCQDGLGWAPGEALICADCRATVEAEGECSACGADSIVSERRTLPESGAVKGLDFRPQTALVRAMRAALLPVPSTPFGPDGWVVASLATLEGIAGLAGSAAIEIEQERDAYIEAYRLHLLPSESLIAREVPANGLKQRDVRPEQFPWAYVSRMSLAAAFTRRLMARGRLRLPTEATAAVDELAAWLEQRFTQIYDRDLCFAEVSCCQEYEWT